MLLLFYPVFLLTSIVTQETYPYYSFQFVKNPQLSLYNARKIINPKYWVKRDLEFKIRVHQMKFTSVGMMSDGALCLTDSFKHGTPARQFKIFSEIPKYNRLSIYSSTGVFVTIFNNGTIQFTIKDLFGKLSGRNLTIKITDGIYNQKTENRQYLTSRRHLQTFRYTVPSLRQVQIIDIVPIARCSVQKSYDSCISESLVYADCNWCSKQKRCENENNRQKNELIGDDCNIRNIPTSNNSKRITTIDNIFELASENVSESVGLEQTTATTGTPTNHSPRGVSAPNVSVRMTTNDHDAYSSQSASESDHLMQTTTKTVDHTVHSSQSASVSDNSIRITTNADLIVYSVGNIYMYLVLSIAIGVILGASIIVCLIKRQQNVPA
ncbi:unnamed protein product [Schistosoma turkestanicum]|nr:unnamed protein product [Schistosoma turkestanicum]